MGVAYPSYEKMAAELENLQKKNSELADQVKRLVITESRLYETQEQNDSQVRVYQQLYEYGKKFNTCFDIDEIFRLTAEFVLYELNISCCQIFLYEPEIDSFSLYMQEGIYDQDLLQELKKVKLSLSEPAIAASEDPSEKILCTRTCSDDALLDLGRRLNLSEYQMHLLTGSRQEPYAFLIMGNLQKKTEFNTRISPDGDMMIGLANLVALVSTSINNLRSYQDLEEANKLKDEFLANTSHELRTPLHGIIGIADSMAEGATGKLTQEQHLNLSLIGTSGRRLSIMINDILDFSRLKHKDIQLQKKPLDMLAVTQVVFMLLQPLVEQKKMKLVNAVSPDTPAVFADEDRMQQILQNLVGNAIKFTEKGSITVSAEVSGKELIVTVSDTGIGIAPDKLEAVFESFEQADGSIERRYPGAGLGLTITRQLVQLHGGQIWVKSKPGKGSEFFFTIPVSKEKAVETRAGHIIRKYTKRAGLSRMFAGKGGIPVFPAGTSANSRSGNVKHILIVDDEPVNLHVVKNQLSGKDYTVYLATSGKEALAVVKENPRFDLILLDIMMPGMSGYAVCRQLREKFAANELPVIMLTAKNRVEDLVAGFKAGANDYLAKPFSKEELLARVDTQIHLKSLVAENTRMQTELDIARRLQRMALPSVEELLDIRDLDIAGFMEPADEVGGDYYDVLRHNGRIKIGIGDVTGHGLLSGVLMLMTQTAVRTLFTCGENDPTAFLDIINRVIYCNARRMQTDKTLSLSLLDYADNTIKISGQHEKMIIVRRDHSVELMDTIDLGFPIGLEEKISNFVNEQSVYLDSGDGVVLYSDGITEAENPDGVQYGLERLCRCAAGQWKRSAQEIKQAVVKDVKAFIDNAIVYDDLTLLVLKQR